MVAVLVLGMIQGLAEFLPVSSSGHLVVAKALMGLNIPGVSLEVGLHLGTLGAVLWCYRRWLWNLGARLRAGDSSAWGIVRVLVIATIPAGMVGLLWGSAIASYYTVPATLVGWLATAGLLWIIPPPAQSDRPLEAIGWGPALVVGMAQALALWPGLSRSGATIAMTRTVGVRAEDAAQFSFLLAIPTVLGAVVLEVPHLMASPIPLEQLIAGALISGACGVIAIKWVRGIVNHPHAWRGFSLYLTALSVAVWLWGG